MFSFMPIVRCQCYVMCVFRQQWKTYFLQRLITRNLWHRYTIFRQIYHYLRWFGYYNFAYSLDLFTCVLLRISLGMRPANERHRYIVTTSLIGWAQTETDTCASCYHRCANGEILKNMNKIVPCQSATICNESYAEQHLVEIFQRESILASKLL